MSLLLTFFVMILSFTVFDDFKIGQIFGALRKSFGAFKITKGEITRFLTEEELNQIIYLQQKDVKERVDKRKVLRMLYHLKEELRGTGLFDFIEIVSLERGISIRIQNPVLFAPGEVQIKPESFYILGRIIELIKYLPNDIEIEGHTDNTPIRTAKYPSNWELSAARASNVARFFISKGVNPARLAVVACGEVFPIVDNSSAENKMKNRRIEIIIRPHISSTVKKNDKEE